MIREQDLLEAIAECQGDRNPDANTCIKLAAFYTILNNMYKDKDYDGADKVSYSHGAGSGQVSYDSGSEFCESIHGLVIDDIAPIIDELMDAIHLISPKLYNATIDRLKRL